MNVNINLKKNGKCKIIPDFIKGKEALVISGVTLALTIFFFSCLLFLHYRSTNVYRPKLKAMLTIKDHIVRTFTNPIQEYKIIADTFKTVKELDLKNYEDEIHDSLATTRLPVFELIIPEKSQLILDSAVDRTYKYFKSKNGLASIFSGVNAPKWPWVSANFKYMGRSYEVKIRYRGWNYDHYLLHKKSWRIKFKKTDLFFGMREINVINSRPPTVFSDVLQAELLKEAGFLLPDQYLVHLRINGEYSGVQTFLEQPDKYFLIRHNRAESDIYGEKSPIDGLDSFEDMANWQKYSSYRAKDDFGSLKKLYSILREKDPKVLKENLENILDVNQYITYLADAAITAKINPSSHNIRLIFDPAIGKFQILPWYQMGYFYLRDYKSYKLFGEQAFFDMDRARSVDLIINEICFNLFKVPEYHEMFYRKIWELINSTHHYSRLLQRANNLYEQIKDDVYADAFMHTGSRPEKYFSNREWEKSIKDFEAMVFSWDRYVRSYLKKSNLSAFSLPVATVNELSEEKLTPISKVVFLTTEMVTPQLESITFKIDGLPENRLGDILLYEDIRGKSNVGKDERLVVKPSKIHTKNGEVTFNFKKRFLSDKEPVPWGTVTASQITVDGFPEPVVLKPLPTVYDFFLALKKNSDPFPFKKINVKIEQVKAINSVTGDYIEPIAIESTNSLVPPFPNRPESYNKFGGAEGLKFIKENNVSPTKTIVWKKGKKIIDETLVFDSKTTLVIQPGTTVEFAEGKSILLKGRLVARGTQTEHIVFKGKDKNAKWGVVAVNAPGKGRSVFEYCLFEGGGIGTVENISYTGALSIHNADALIKNSIFRDNLSNDALNAKYSDLLVENSQFIRNRDAIDFDFSSGQIRGNVFEKNKDDSIDLSFSNVIILHNNINNTGDKGISAGEKSTPLIYNNLITFNNIGIAVKDLSEATVLNNTISKNRTGIALYMKKHTFGGSKAKVLNSIIWGNQSDIEKKDGAEVTVSYSNLSKAYEGEGNISSNPLFKNFEAGNFRVEKKSPSIGSGNNRTLGEYISGESRVLHSMGYTFDQPVIE